MIKQKTAQLHGSLINGGILPNGMHQCGRLEEQKFVKENKKLYFAMTEAPESFT
jgi:hypothetical protein